MRPGFTHATQGKLSPFSLAGQLMALGGLQWPSAKYEQPALPPGARAKKRCKACGARAQPMRRVWIRTSCSAKSRCQGVDCEWCVWRSLPLFVYRA